MINLRSKTAEEKLLLALPRRQQDRVMHELLADQARAGGWSELVKLHTAQAALTATETPGGAEAGSESAEGKSGGSSDSGSLLSSWQQAEMLWMNVASGGLDLAVLCGLRHSEGGWRGVAKKAFLPSGVSRVLQKIQARQQLDQLQKCCAEASDEPPRRL